MRRHFCIWATFTVALAASATIAWADRDDDDADCSVTSISVTPPHLGQVAAAASGNTVFRVDAATGAVTKVSGSGARVSTNSALATVVVSCGTKSGCDRQNINIKIGNIGTPSGRLGSLSNFTVAMGSATLVGSVSGTNPISFTIGPLGKHSSATFYIGMDMTVGGNDSGGATGNATSAFYVYVAPQGHTPISGLTNQATATVFRPISVTKSSDLNFGTIVRPGSGSGTVTIDADTGVRSFAGGVLATPNNAASRAGYVVSGEGGQAFSITVPPSIVMTKGASSLTVTTTATHTGSQVLSSAIGSAGGYGFGVGGSFPVTSTTATGTYTGSFTVTVNYN